MRYYLAPLEGITTYIYRNAYARYFGGIDKYFTPFISDKNMRAGKKTSSREIRDLLPENNVDVSLVPQILTNKVNVFLAIADKISSYGYRAVNLNLGCPSGTVTAKKRGSGFLSVPDELDAFLYGIFEKCPLEISVKTRLGVYDLAEWDRLLTIYGKYPISELIIHTRLQQEFYTGNTHPEAYAAAAARLGDTSGVKIPLCYNGDIVSKDSLKAVQAQVDKITPIDRVMLGRGIIRNPGLIYRLKADYDNALSKERLRAFHDEILEGYIKIMSGDSPVLFKMKDLWTYMSESFADSGKYLKKIRKTSRVSEYVSVVDGMFRELELTP